MPIGPTGHKECPLGYSRKTLDLPTTRDPGDTATIRDTHVHTASVPETQTHVQVRIGKVCVCVCVSLFSLLSSLSLLTVPHTAFLVVVLAVLEPILYTSMSSDSEIIWQLLPK